MKLIQIILLFLITAWISTPEAAEAQGDCCPAANTPIGDPSAGGTKCAGEYTGSSRSDEQIVFIPCATSGGVLVTWYYWYCTQSWFVVASGNTGCACWTTRCTEITDYQDINCVGEVGPYGPYADLSIQRQCCEGCEEE